MIAKCLILLVGWIPVLAIAQSRSPLENSPVNPGYEESAVAVQIELPAFPKPERLVEFYVSAVTPNKFLIDAATLGVGADGIVRYTLVVRTSGGAENITFEGMNCKEGKWRLYATGRADGSWVRSRSSDWRFIENKPVNRHHAALSRDLFCPNGGTLLNADEGRTALRLGKHPHVMLD